MKIKIGTRSSKLALWQTKKVEKLLKDNFPDLETNIITIKTKGDIVKTENIQDIGVGIFVKEIEEALLKNEIDIAVHSLKDLPINLKEDFSLGAFLKRDIPNDVFISEKYNNIKDLKPYSKIGTSSQRRKSQINFIRKDLNILPLRGNIDSRIRKLKNKDLDAIILAGAGIYRLNLKKEIKEILPLNIFTPSIGQGIIAVEARRKDKDILNILKKINNAESEFCYEIEKAFMENIGGGCSLPVGVICEKKLDQYNLITYIGNTSGENVYKEEISIKEINKDYAKKIALKMLKDGAKQVLDEIRNK